MSDEILDVKMPPEPEPPQVEIREDKNITMTIDEEPQATAEIIPAQEDDRPIKPDEEIFPEAPKVKKIKKKASDKQLAHLAKMREKKAEKDKLAAEKKLRDYHSQTRIDTLNRQARVKKAALSRGMSTRGLDPEGAQVRKTQQAVESSTTGAVSVLEETGAMEDEIAAKQSDYLTESNKPASMLDVGITSALSLGGEVGMYSAKKGDTWF